MSDEPRPVDPGPRVPSTAAIVLAAGGGSRFGGAAPKLLATLRGRPLVCHAVDAARDAAIGPVYVVQGAVDLTAVLPDDVVVIDCEDWEAGLAVSLQAALAVVERDGHDAAVVGLGDSPFVGADAWRAVAASPSPVAFATFGGQRHPPTRLARRIWPLLPLDGDGGARSLATRRPELVVEVPCDGDPTDIDTVEDLRRWS